MNPSFSFHYGEKQYTFSAKNNAVYVPECGITVSVLSKIHQAYDATEWVLYFENTSDHDSQIFSDIWDSDTLLPLTFSDPPRPGYKPTAGDACVITMNGTVSGKYYWENDRVSASEYGFHYQYLDKAPNKTKRFSNIGGRSSDGMMPFFDVTASGSGYIAAIGWTGDWKTEFVKCEQGIQMRSGLKETAFYLKPGEKVRTSSVLIMKYGQAEDKYNKFRGLIRNHFSHKSCTAAERDGLMAFELWGGLSSEEMKKRIRRLKDHDVRFEDIWIDAGWYGSCTKCDDTFSGDWSEKTGEWTVNTRVHPGALADVAECAREAGARLMLWLEPERAKQGTPVTEQHPDWFLTLPDRTSRILNYGNDEAFRYVYELLSNYIKNLELSCYRQDFNTKLTDYFKEHDEENRRGITEIKHIMGMYRLWDTLLKEFPHLLIDNCASGGRRIDIEMLRRSIPLWRSDVQCPANFETRLSQMHHQSFNTWMPYSGTGSGRAYDIYRARSAYDSSMT
ncbi:MAG: alpha-galactosidase, partial [Clostridia bacterium]|nr:alpha-galactosidase [Clostridia bacterium]